MNEPGPRDPRVLRLGANGLTELRAYLDVLAEDDLFSGAVLVAKNGIPAFTYVCGLANRRINTPNRIDTKFNLGSMNKMFTGLAICQLAERGKLDFFDRVQRHLPDYPNAGVAKRVTIHNLLTHTSGMGSYWTEPYKPSKKRLRQVRDYFPLFVDERLAFEPGEAWQYSNAGYIVLGAIVERVSGQNYFEYVKQRIYARAGMNDTDTYETDDDVRNLATGYTNEGGFGRRCDNTYLLPTKGGPAGGGFSTLENLLRFDMALREYRLLSPRYTEIMLTGKVATRKGGDFYGYGFGVRQANGFRIMGHNGGFPGVSSVYRMYRETGYTVVVMSNYDPPIADQIADWIERRGVLAQS